MKQDRLMPEPAAPLYAVPQSDEDTPHAGGSIFVRMAILALLVSTLILAARLLMEYNDLREEAAALRAEIADTEQSIEALQDQLDAPFDDDYVIKIAKEKLNLSLPQEIIFYNDLNE
ncbi:MAG: septum formation initiator family protein [Clostridia bacterium]|nr:septum formation initiator family protein [Clostridia bacterium]